MDRRVFFNNFVDSIDEKNIKLPLLNWFICHLSDGVRYQLNLEPEKNRKSLVLVILLVSDFNEMFDTKVTRTWLELKGLL